jgi:hypothetical protein
MCKTFILSFTGRIERSVCRERKGLDLEFRTVIEEYFHRIVENSEWFPKVRDEV